MGFVSDLVDRWILKFTQLFEPDNPDQFAQDYANISANKYMTPNPGDADVQALLDANQYIMELALMILGFLLIFIITKEVMNAGRNSKLMMTVVRIIIGLGILVFNTEILFGFYTAVDTVVHFLVFLRGLVLAEHLADQPVGMGAIATRVIHDSVFFAIRALAYLLTLLSIVILGVALYIRSIILHALIVFIPIAVVIWVFGPMVNLRKTGMGMASRALFFVIPLIVLLTVIEIVQPGSATSQPPPGNITQSGVASSNVFAHLIKSFSIFAAVYLSAKLSIAGRMAVSATKTAGTTAALVGAAAVVGGVAAGGGANGAAKVLGKVGLAKIAGRPGMMIGRAMDAPAGGGGGGAAGGGGDMPLNYEKKQAATPDDFDPVTYDEVMNEFEDPHAQQAVMAQRMYDEEPGPGRDPWYDNTRFNPGKVQPGVSTDRTPQQERFEYMADEQYEDYASRVQNMSDEEVLQSEIPNEFLQEKKDGVADKADIDDPSEHTYERDGWTARHEDVLNDPYS